MARIRSIKPEFWTSEQVGDCSTTARLLFIGLWNFCDDAGRHPASLKRLKMEVLPGDDYQLSEIRKLVEELISAGLLIEYEVKKERFWVVTGWHHQKIEKPRERYPAPPKSATNRRPIGDQSPLEWSGVEGSVSLGGERKKKTFQAPTIEEVRALCLERNNGIDPESFVAHYESIGWVQGKHRKPIKSWKAAMITWEKNRKQDDGKCEVLTPEEGRAFNAGWRPNE